MKQVYLLPLVIIALLVVEPVRAFIQDRTETTFKGSARRVAKTTMLRHEDVPIETFTSVAALRATLIPDVIMRRDNPSVERNDTERVDDEKRLVVVNAFLYAAKSEEDGDWHLILGDKVPAGQTLPSSRELLNVEVSGVPKREPGESNADHDERKASFIEARKQFLAVVNNRPIGHARYTKLDPPMKVKLGGSLFFDADHSAGTVGPTGLRPNTVWEIHPVHSIRKRQ
jgi:hypothetical protein